MKNRFFAWLKFNFAILFHIFCLNFRIHLSKRDFLLFLPFCLLFAVFYEFIFVPIFAIIAEFLCCGVLETKVFLWIFLPLQVAIIFAFFYASKGVFRLFFGIGIFFYFYLTTLKGFIQITYAIYLSAIFEAFKFNYFLIIFVIISIIFIFFSKKTSEFLPLSTLQIFLRILFVCVNLAVILIVDHLNYKMQYFLVNLRVYFSIFLISLIALIFLIGVRLAKNYKN